MAVAHQTGKLSNDFGVIDVLLRRKAPQGKMVIH